MDHYHLWCDLRPGVRDLDFVAAVDGYLDHLRDQGHLSAYALARRKLGFGPPELGEFHLRIDAESLAQLDAAFLHAATRTDPVESLHRAVYSKVENLRTALYRDFPDPQRQGATGT